MLIVARSLVDAAATGFAGAGGAAPQAAEADAARFASRSASTSVVASTPDVPTGEGVAHTTFQAAS